MHTNSINLIILIKEFLNKIKEERYELIEAIDPAIFKKFCFCMNGFVP
jgi:hypothetical protein